MRALLRFRRDGTTNVIHIDDALDTWGRWCTWGNVYGPRPPACGSLEGRYSPPQVWETAEPAEDDPDWRVGEKVERIVIRLPARHRYALKLWYVERPAIKRSTGMPLVPDDEVWSMRRLNVGSLDRWREVLDQARTMVEVAYR